MLVRLRLEMLKVLLLLPFCAAAVAAADAVRDCTMYCVAATCVYVSFVADRTASPAPLNLREAKQREDSTVLAAVSRFVRQAQGIGDAALHSQCPMSIQSAQRWRHGRGLPRTLIQQLMQLSMQLHMRLPCPKEPLTRSRRCPQSTRPGSACRRAAAAARAAPCTSVRRWTAAQNPGEAAGSARWSTAGKTGTQPAADLQAQVKQG